MKSVQFLALQATAKGDALKLNATGLVSDDETAGLMEDALRGVLAAWRLAAQEKSPETVSVLRKFAVTRDKDDGLHQRHAAGRDRPCARREEARARANRLSRPERPALDPQDGLTGASPRS